MASTQIVEFQLEARSSAAAEEVLASAREFSPRRIEMWPNVSAKRYEVHAAGETFTEVTEGALQGLFWERSRYEWPGPDSVQQVVIDSNVLAPGSSWEITASPNGSGCQVECRFRRRFRRTPKGLFGWALNRFAGRPVYGSDLRRALDAIEKESGQSPEGGTIR